MSQSEQGQANATPTAGPDLGPNSSPNSGTSRRESLQAVLVALVCAVLFLRESLLPGNALVPHPPELFDVHMAEAKANGTFDAEDTFRGNVGMTDKYLQSLCWDRVMQDRLRDGEVPRWTRDIGGGAPFVPQMAQPYQPINVLLLLMPSVEWYGWWYLVHLVLFGWFAYLFLRRIGCVHGAALLGLVAATLGMWTQCKLHHNVILTAALSLWPMLSATHALVAVGVRDGARRRAVGWLAMWTGLSWSTGFVVIALQASYMTGAFAMLCALRTDRGDRLRRLWPFAIALGIGGVLSLANMLPILLASAESARVGQFDAARLQSLGLDWDHLLSLPWPDLLSWPADHFYPKGGESLVYETRMPLSQLVLLENPTRPEDSTAVHNWVETSFAVGVIPLAAAVTALFSKRHRVMVVFFAAFGFLAFGIATGDQPFFSLARILPGMTAGDVRRLLFSVAMPLVVLAGLGCDVWLRDGLRWPGRAMLALIAAMSAVVVIWALVNSSEDEFLQACAKLYALDTDHPRVMAAKGDPTLIAQAVKAVAEAGEPEVNRQHLLNGAIWALLMSLAGFGALSKRWSLVFANSRLFTVIALVSATVIELLVMGLGPMQTVPAERVTAVPKVLAPVVLASKRDEQPQQPRPRMQRLLTAGMPSNGLPGNMPGFLGLADANAYNPLPPARFEQFFETIEPGMGYGGAGVGSFHDPKSLTHPLCDLYGIRYIVTNQKVKQTATMLDRTPEGTGSFRLLERTTAMPRATFVRNVDVIADTPPLPDVAADEHPRPAQARLDALGKRDRDVRNRIVLERKDVIIPTAADNVTADVQITLHDDEEVKLNVTCSHDGYVRLADPFDKGWRATVDGEPADILIADHYLRAVYVEPGEHQIVFTYDGARVVWPLRLTLLAWAFVLACFVTGRRKSPGSVGGTT
ncbi:MAG: hypothetical protein ACI89X_003999 [Planctomycetota bacterium]|jgi:hypothetical protein